MIKSLADAFNSPDAKFNDPLFEIHNPVQPCEEPTDSEYQEFYNHLNTNAYPTPVDKIVHNTINPLHGALKPYSYKL